jgi:glycosyltransferase involved in cell wall biosynthesis
MKIGIVCFNIDWQAGGPRLLLSSAKAMQDLGHVVIIYAPELSTDAYKELWKGLDFRIVKPREFFTWTGRTKNIFKWIFRKIRQERLHIDTAKRIAEAMDKDFDVVNLHDFAYRVSYFYKKINPRAKILWTQNDPPYVYLPKENPVFDLLSRIYNRLKDFMSRRYFKAIDKSLVLDLHNEEWAKKRGLKPVMIRDGIDFKNFYAPVKDISEKSKAKSFQIMGLGALTSYRRFEDTILAVKLLREQGYDARALIIAADIWEEGECRAKLQNMVEENKLEHFIELRFKPASNEELQKAYWGSDMFAMTMYLPPPRNGYGWGLINFEAMAAGLPLIINRTCAATEVLVDGKHALFVDPMSPEQIAEKAKMLIDDPGLYYRIATAGQKFVKENMSWEKYAKQILSAVGINS